MEIEAKFRVDDPAIFSALLQLAALGDFRLVPADQVENQRNTYFDTADRRLRQRQFGLRVRDLGARQIATLKGAAQVRDGLYERSEWEVDVVGDDPRAWPAGEVRDRVLELIGDAPLLPTLSISTRRQHIYAELGAARVAEISLDEGDISAGGLEQHFRELEIELVEGHTRSDFDDLVGILRDRFSLVPEDQSKLARGLALLDRAEAARLGR